MNKHVLIIGGSNYIGWELLSKLSEYELIVVNRGNKDRVYPENVKHIVSDRSSLAENYKSVIESSDAVIDMCAYSSEDIKSTIKITKHVEQYVLISSAAVYLESEIFPISENFEKGKHNTWGEYGYGKLKAENTLIDNINNNCSYTIVRPSYVYGNSNPIHRERFLYERIRYEDEVLIPRGGDAIIQLGHVDDLTEFLKKLMFNKKSYNEIFNYSSEEYIKLTGLVTLASELLGKEANTKFVDTKKFNISDREIFPFDNQTYFTDITRAKELIGMCPKINLREGLQKAFLEYDSKIDYKKVVSREKEKSITEKLNLIK